jgi:iron complex outermembrane recepter protein
MNGMKPLSRRLALAFGGSLVIASASVYAQATQPDAQKQERIEVTGSNIKRIDAETAAPVQIITREQIERSGASSISEVLRNLPSNNAGSFGENSQASFTPGAAAVSIRGLGAGSTLILLNGRRITPYGFASGGQTQFVDTNSIPLDVVERVEVLLDGASAIYGSEAVAGVINIILRKDFQGFEGRLGAGSSSYSDANSYRVGATFGKGSLGADRYNVMGNVEFTKQNGVLATERPNTQTSDFRRFGLLDYRSRNSYPGNLYTNAGALIGPLGGCPALNDPTAAAALQGACIYDFAKYTSLIADTKRITGLLSGTYEAGAFQLFSDLSLSQTKFTQPAGAYSWATYAGIYGLPATIILPVGHPQNTTAAPIRLRYRFADVPQTADVTSNTQRLVLGARGSLANWDWESALLYSGSDTSYTQTGFVRDSVLFSQVIDPNSAGNTALPSFIFGNPGANAPGVINALYPTIKNKGTTSITGVDAKGSTELTQLPGGPLGLAVGVEARRESYVSTPDALVQAGEFSVLGSSSSNGSRTISSAFMEVSLPFIKGIEAQLAARMDKYPSFGTSVTPKASIKWKPLNTLAVRGSYSEGFRAPSLTELTQSPTQGFYNNIRDPKNCAAPDVNNPACSLSVPVTIGSNPSLQPEKSKSYTAGIVFEPIKEFSIAVDYYDIKRRNEIANIDPEYLLANESLYPGLVVRDATGNLTALNLSYQNLSTTHVKGYDVDVRGRFNLATAGKLTLGAVYSAEPTYKAAPTPTAPELEYAGTYNQPKERYRLTATWEYGSWETTLTSNYVGSFLRAFTPSDLSCPYSGGQYESLCKVNSWSTVDLFVAYNGFKNLSLSMSVKNLENKQPPIDERAASRFNLYNTGYHNALGRYLALNAKYSFK